MKLLYLLRHGESEGNRDNKFRGRIDFGLTERGKIQAQQAGSFLKGVPFDIIYTSPLKRAYDTAVILQSFIKTEIVIDESFTNISLGPWEGKPKEFVRENFPEEWNIWITKPEELYIEGIESLNEVMKRSLGRVEKIREMHQGNVLIVTHRAVLKPLLAGLLEIPPPYFWKLHVDTAAVSIVEWLGPSRGWMLKNLNINHYLHEYREEQY